MQRHAFDLDGLRHLVARGARDRRDDGQLRPRQGVEQRAFARIRLAGDHHLDTFAQQGALARALHHRGQGGAQLVELAVSIGLLQKVDFFFGEIERGFYQHAQVHQSIAQAVDFLREGARQRTTGAARSGLGAGVDQIGNGLGLCQVDLVVQKCALGELARLSQTQAGQGGLATARQGLRRFQATRQQQLQHYRAAVRLQLQHVFAGVAVRRRKVQRQPLVDRLAVGGFERQIRRLARLQSLAAQQLHQGRNRFARHAHNPHGTAPRRSGNGNNRIVVAGKHGRSLGGKVPVAAASALLIQ